jgi:NADPH2:quinone reductase
VEVIGRPVEVSGHGYSPAMKTTAARLIEHRAPLRVEDVDLKETGPDEVLVEMAFGGVNPVDRYGAMGLAAPDGPLPRTLGTEGSGIVDGKPVLVHGSGVGTKCDGLWATKAVVPRQSVTEVPDGVELAFAASIGVAGATAWNVVKEVAQTTSEDRVLVLGATGGVGGMIVSLAHSTGATVWGQTRNESNRTWISEMGADGVIISDGTEMAKSAGELSPTVVFDPLGGGFTGQAISVMAEHGRLVLFGTSASQNGELPLQMVYRKGLTIFGYGGLIASQEVLANAKRRALEAVADRSMKVAVTKAFPLSEVNDALSFQAGGSAPGNVLLDLGS